MSSEQNKSGSHGRPNSNYRLAEIASHPRIIHSGKLKVGEQRGAVFKLDIGTLIIGSASMIHVEVIERAGFKIEEGIYLSGFIHVTDDCTLEWITSGAMSSFPPDMTGLPIDELLDRIRGTGVRIAK